MKLPNRKPNAECYVCGVSFYAWRPKDDKTNCCSIECKSEYTRLEINSPKIKRAYEKRGRAIRRVKSVKKMSKTLALAKTHNLTPAQSAKIRGKIASLMNEHISHANEVVLGLRDWGPTQARVFSTLLNKVVPDLNASYHQHEHSVKDVIDMSRDELERIAAGIDAIDAEVIPDEDKK